MGDKPDKKFARSRWAVERERCRIEDARPPASARDPLGIGQIIPGVMKKLGLDEQRKLAVLAEEWGQIVGNGVAKHTRPGRLDGGELLVFVDSSVWLGELARYGSEEILAKLAQKLGPGKIRSLKLRLDPDRR